MLLVELVTDRESKAPLRAADTLAVVRRAVSNGVLLIRAGLFSNCIRFLPPLNMPEDMLREGLDVVGRAIEAAIQRRCRQPSGCTIRQERGVHTIVNAGLRAPQPRVRGRGRRSGVGARNVWKEVSHTWTNK